MVASALSKWSMLDVWIAALVATMTSVQISIVTCTGTLLKGTTLFFLSQLLAGMLLVSATGAAVVPGGPSRSLTTPSRSVAFAMYQRRGKLAVFTVRHFQKHAGSDGTPPACCEMLCCVATCCTAAATCCDLGALCRCLLTWAARRRSCHFSLCQREGLGSHSSPAVTGPLSHQVKVLGVLG